MDDMAFPSYSSSTIRSKKTSLDEIGDCFVRELDFSKITLRLREKGESKGDEKKDNTIAKLTGNTLDTLKQCLVSDTPTLHRSCVPVFLDLACSNKLGVLVYVVSLLQNANHGIE